MGKNKVLILTNHSYMLWRFRKELIAELMKEREVVLGMPFVGHEEDFQKMGLRCIPIEIDRRGINPKRDWKLIKRYQKLLAEEKPDLVITYSIKPNIYAGLLCRRMKIPYCANVQGLGTAFQKKGLAQFVTFLYKMAFQAVQTVFFENEGNAQEFLMRGILPKEKQTVLHGAGINLEQYALEPYPENEIVHFLYLGRIMREKGIDELFSAVKRLRNDGERFVLDLVGFFEDSYKEQVEQLERQNIVCFHGFQEDPRPFYAAADCVVLPSYHEGMSNVLLEAAAAGRPLITSDIPGCREAVNDGISGFLVEVKNSDQLYEAMKRILHTERSEREKMGMAGRTKMEQEFRKEAVVAETVQSIKRIEAR
ncbi:MAG: glycosyltransferase family 4 protein [Butyricicoccus sp.]